MASRQSENPARGPLLTLFFGNFVIGTGTLLIAGMLNLISSDLRISATAVGQLITGFGLASCFGAPVLAAVTSHIDRRRLLVAALLLFAVGNLLTAVAPSYLLVMLLRIIAGFGAAIYTPQAAATAGLVVPPERRGRAVALVFLGWSVASVLGNPLGIFLGAAFGWRMSLAVIGVFAACCAGVLYAQLPRGLYVQRMDRAAWRTVWRDVALLLVLATTILQSTGQYTVSVYLAAIFQEQLGATSGMIALLFSWFGVCGVLGNLAAGLWIDRIGSARIVTVTMSLMLAALLLWPLTRGSLPMTLLAVGLWGLGSFATNGTQQARLIALSPHVASASVALNSSSFYLGQAAGAMTGGTVLAAFSMNPLSWVAAAIMVLALGSSFAVQIAVRSAGGAIARVADESN